MILNSFRKMILNKCNYTKDLHRWCLPTTSVLFQMGMGMRESVLEKSDYR